MYVCMCILNYLQNVSVSTKPSSGRQIERNIYTACVCTQLHLRELLLYTHVSRCKEVIAAADIIFVTAHNNKNIREKSLKNKRGYLV